MWTFRCPIFSDYLLKFRKNLEIFVNFSEIPPQNYEVEYHLHQGEVISFQLGDGRVEIIPGKDPKILLFSDFSLVKRTT